MSILEVLNLIAALDGAGKSILDVVQLLKGQGHPDNVPIPADHLAMIKAALQPVQQAVADPQWDANHQEAGG